MRSLDAARRLRFGLAFLIGAPGILLGASPACVRAPSIENVGPLQAGIIVSEESQHGIRLALAEENAKRLRYVTPGGEARFDRQPVYHPGGRHVVYVSSRSRSESKQAGLWLVDLHTRENIQLDAGLTSRDPVFGPQGKLYFAAKEGEFFRIHRATLELTHKPRLRDLEVIDPFEDHARSPTLAQDGTVVCERIDALGQSSLWTKAKGSGPWAQLTQGPKDRTPRFSPSGTLAFSALRDRGDYDVFVLRADGERQVLLDEPEGDELDPRFDADGRFGFATSIYRSPLDSQSTFSSLLVFDLGRSETGARRALLFNDFAESNRRLGIALPGFALDGSLLRQNLEYREGLRRVALESLVEQEIEAKERSQKE